MHASFKSSSGFAIGLMVDMAYKKYFKLYFVLLSSSNENWFALSTNTV